MKNEADRQETPQVSVAADHPEMLGFLASHGTAVRSAARVSASPLWLACQMHGSFQTGCITGPKLGVASPFQVLLWLLAPSRISRIAGSDPDTWPAASPSCGLSPLGAKTQPTAAEMPSLMPGPALSWPRSVRPRQDKGCEPLRGNAFLFCVHYHSFLILLYAPDGVGHAQQWSLQIDVQQALTDLFEGQHASPVPVHAVEEPVKLLQLITGHAALPEQHIQAKLCPRNRTIAIRVDLFKALHRKPHPVGVVALPRGYSLQGWAQLPDLNLTLESPLGFTKYQHLPCGLSKHLKASEAPLTKFAKESTPSIIKAQDSTRPS